MESSKSVIQHYLKSHCLGSYVEVHLELNGKNHSCAMLSKLSLLHALQEYKCQQCLRHTQTLHLKFLTIFRHLHHDYGAEGAHANSVCSNETVVIVVGVQER